MTLSSLPAPLVAVLFGLLTGIPSALFVLRFLGQLDPEEYTTPGAFFRPSILTFSCVLPLAYSLQFGLSAHFWVYSVLGVLFLTASFIDLYSYILPDELIYPTMLFAPLASLFLLHMPANQCFGGAVLGAGFFILLQFAYRKLRGIEGLGTGDIKLMFALGALTGLHLLPIAVLLACISTLIAAAVADLAGKKLSLHSQMPFGPFLCLGTALTLLYGTDIMNWYLKLVL